MYVATHEDVSDARPTERRAMRAPATVRPSAQRAFKVAGNVAKFILFALAAATTIIALRAGLYGLGHPEQPFFRSLSQLWN